jgi:hypothetical protein
LCGVSICYIIGSLKDLPNVSILLTPPNKRQKKKKKKEEEKEEVKGWDI